MKTYDLALKDILQELKGAPQLEKVNFVSAYGRKSFRTPVMEVIASVGIDGLYSNVKSGALSVRIQKEKRVTAAVDLFSPLDSGGEACAETLAAIAQVLEQGGGAQHREIETYPVKYDSNACAFRGSLKLNITETLHGGESQLEEDARSISVSINGLPVFYVRQAEAESDNRVYPVECFGENGACFFTSRGGAHTVTLGRFLTEEIAVDIFALDNFSMRIASGGRSALFEGCRWERVEQAFQSSSYLTERAVIRAEKRVETGEAQ